MSISATPPPTTFADVSPIFTPAPQGARPALPQQLPNQYANGQSVYDFHPNGVGGQAGQYQVYDEHGTKRLNLNTSQDGHVGFAQSYNDHGVSQSTTIYGENGQAQTMSYGS
ncbi:hypothetical protein QYH69_16965 [Paraburkholderia sp. SARCC-3016]|uniref:hypothetical protein n=1 Tax=Paraburkholderia sp. SARCC-3016 TaxID=3058611 RepID=UPI00280765DD|nr:hypothetical protein [Paraburkholderia sp. SARCC-3016]MDQ7978942.1 hypothetical protein [Paraburkholderia sp. SARCC-3016]